MARNKKRTLVLIKPKDPDDPIAGNFPLGTPKELNTNLGKFNTKTDGSTQTNRGTVVLHGPGFTVEYAEGHTSIMQAMVLVNNTDFAWPVLSKLCKAAGWKMQDADSGQIFG